MRRNQKVFSADIIDYSYNTSYDSSFIWISYANAIYSFETNTLPNIIIDYDKKQARIACASLPEIKKMDEYFASSDFMHELFMKLNSEKSKHSKLHIQFESESDEDNIRSKEDINDEILHICECINLYTYESLFKDTVCTLKLVDSENYGGNYEIVPIKILKKSSWEIKKLSLEKVKNNADTYLTMTNNSKYRFGTASYCKSIGFKFPSAKCVLRLDGIDINHEKKTYSLRIHMVAIQYIDNLEVIDSMSIPEKKL